MNQSDKIKDVLIKLIIERDTIIKKVKQIEESKKYYSMGELEGTNYAIALIQKAFPKLSEQIKDNL